MGCRSCNKPSRQARLQDDALCNMTTEEIKQKLMPLNFKQLLEMCKLQHSKYAPPINQRGLHCTAVTTHWRLSRHICPKGYKLPPCFLFCRFFLFGVFVCRSFARFVCCPFDRAYDCAYDCVFGCAFVSCFDMSIRYSFYCSDLYLYK